MNWTMPVSTSSTTSRAATLAEKAWENASCASDDRSAAPEKTRPGTATPTAFPTCWPVDSTPAAAPACCGVTRASA
jgi:hypothetical protein